VGDRHGRGVLVSALAVVLGAVCAVGIVLIVAGLLSGGSGISRKRSRRTNSRSLEQGAVRVAAALVAATAVFLLTQWVTAALATAAGVLVAPSVRARQQDQQARLAKAEALPVWCEMLRDMLQGAHGLETVIKATAHIAPMAIRADTALLAADLNRMSLRDALLAFADRVADPICDQVVMGLRIEGGELSSVLGSIVQSARDGLEVRRRVDAGRASYRWTARFTIAVTLVFALGLSIFDRKYLSAYDGYGQFLLLIVLACFGLGLWMMALVTRGETPKRLLVADGAEAPP